MSGDVFCQFFCVFTSSYQQISEKKVGNMQAVFISIVEPEPQRDATLAGTALALALKFRA
jgi:hypothetical protein